MAKHTFLVSDETVNNQGFKVLTEGIQLQNFTKNPIMFFQHERPHVIGRWENLTKKDGKLYADAIFDVDDPLGKEIERKVASGFLNSASIGGFALEQSGDLVTKLELFEISIVDIGSNSNAVKLYSDSAEMIRLNFQNINTQNELRKVLGLQNINETEVLKSVRLLKEQNIKLVADKTKVESDFEAHKTEISESLINQAIELNLLPLGLKNVQRMAFKQDFKTAYKDIKQLLNDNETNRRHTALKEVILGGKGDGKSEKTVKLKSEWDLDDYRANAPQELEQNPELYKDLIKKKYNK